MMLNTVRWRKSPNTTSANQWGNEYTSKEVEVLDSGVNVEHSCGFVKTKIGVAGFRSWRYSAPIFTHPGRIGVYIYIFYNGMFYEITLDKYLSNKTEAIREVRKAVNHLIDVEEFKNAGKE